MLALIASFALLAAASAQPNCKTQTKGQITGDARTLPVVELRAGISTYDVTIPPNACGLKIVVGVTVTACDEVVAPDVILYNNLRGKVTRHHSFTNGYLYTVVYCA